MKDEQKLLIRNKRGRIVSEYWLKEFGLLPKPEQDIILLLMEKKANFKDEAISNFEIAESLSLPVKKVFEKTKNLVDKSFLEVETIQVEEKTRGIKHFYLPSNSSKYLFEPGFSKIESLKTEEPKNQSKSLDPTVVENTYKKIDPDTKIFGEANV